MITHATLPVRNVLGALLSLWMLAACSDSPLQSAVSTPMRAATVPSTPSASAKGRGSAMPAYYDHKLFTINFTELTTAELTILAHNPGFNNIYQSDQDPSFVSVIDAVPGDGMNPLWREVQVIFVTIVPRQFFSDDEILAAAAAGQIRLEPTTEVYRCSVIGPSKP